MFEFETRSQENQMPNSAWVTFACNCRTWTMMFLIDKCLNVPYEEPVCVAVQMSVLRLFHLITTP